MTTHLRWIFAIGSVGLFCTGSIYANPREDATAPAPVVKEAVVVDSIWPAVPVRYCLLTHEQMQYVAYYNADRRMAVAQRKLGEDTFEKFVLPSESDKPPRHTKLTTTIQGWDSHNSITMCVDADGYIHLAGNMHADPLLYFRSTKPHDITTLKQVKAMTGEREGQVTYPRFMNAPKGDLVFLYRDGKSGSGENIYNIYDLKTQTWKRLLDKPLHGDGDKRNAYGGPRMGSDGKYHMTWLWRETMDCSTNHDISYARSPDLIHWETAAGERIDLPITLRDKGTIVDPSPVKGGLLNMGNGFGLDSKNRPIVTYTRYDDDGNTQAYATRFEDGQWKIRQLTDWKYRFNFSGGGSIKCLVRVHSPEFRDDGTLALPYKHVKYGDGVLILDEASLKLLRTEKPRPTYPPELVSVKSTFKPKRGSGMQVNWKEDSGASPEGSKDRYVLRWETLGRNRDRPRRGALPENGELVVYRLTQPNGPRP